MQIQQKVTVFGATGKIGRELLPLLSGAQIPTIAVTRNKNKAPSMPFVEWTEADMSDRSTLHKAIGHSTDIFLASSVGNRFIEEQSNVIAEALQVGVKHLVKISSPGAAKDSPNLIARPNGEVDAFLKASGLPYTILQPTAFMQNWLGGFSETIKKERRIYEATGDGKRPFIDTRDIAEVAFRVLTDTREHVNQTHLLTGGTALSYGEVAAEIGKVIGEEVQYISLSSEQLRTRMEQAGLPKVMVDMFVSMAESTRRGEAGFVNEAVYDILHRRPGTVFEFVWDNVQWFK